MKYREDLVEKVRNGEAQVQVDGDEKWLELIRYIQGDELKISIRKEVYSIFFNQADKIHGGWWEAVEPIPDLLVIHAKDFLIQEPEVNWVEVRGNDSSPWLRRILIADLGEQVDCRFVTLNEGFESRYMNGEKDMPISRYRFMRPIPQPEPLTHAEIEKLIGKPFKYVEE